MSNFIVQGYVRLVHTLSLRADDMTGGSHGGCTSVSAADTVYRASAKMVV